MRGLRATGGLFLISAHLIPRSTFNSALKPFGAEQGALTLQLECKQRMNITTIPAAQLIIDHLPNGRQPSLTGAPDPLSRSGYRSEEESK